MENHETHVSQELAVKLIHAGFHWKEYLVSHQIDLPFQWEIPLDIAQKWLREVKNINIEVTILSITSGNLLWYANIYYLKNHNGVYDEVKLVGHTWHSYETYELALEAGINLVIDNLDNIEKYEKV